MLKRTTKPLRRVLIQDSLAKSSKKQHSENTDKRRLCKAGSFSYGESPWTPPLEGTSLHRWNNSVERPWGILSLFTTCLQVQSPCHSLWHMSNTPPKSTLRREEPSETLKEQNHKKIWDVGRSVSKRPQRKHSEWKEPYETLNRAKPISNNNSWAEKGQRKSPKMNQSNRKWALWKPLRRRVIQNPMKNNKTTKKKSSDRRRPS